MPCYRRANSAGGPLDGLSDRDARGNIVAIEFKLVLHHDADGKDVLAGLAAGLEILAGAAGSAVVGKRCSGPAHSAMALASKASPLSRVHDHGPPAGIY